MSIDQNTDTCPEDLSKFCEEKSHAPRTGSGKAALILETKVMANWIFVFFFFLKFSSLMK